MNALFPGTEATPRYSPLFDKHVLANWIALIAEDRGLDAAAVAALTGLDTHKAGAILDGDVRTMPVATLDAVLRVLEGRTTAPATVPCGAC